MLKLILPFILTFIFVIPMTASAADFTMQTLPVQNGGRIKPFDTYARESLMLTYGRAKYHVEDGKSQDALRIISTWVMVPEHWETKEFIRLDHLGLKKALNLPEDRKFFSPSELIRNSRMGILFSELSGKRQIKEKLNPFDQATQRLEMQLMLFHEIKGGGIRLAPNPDPNNSNWLSLAELSEEQRLLFFEALKAYSRTFTPETENSTEYVPVLAKFTESAAKNNPAAYPTEKRMSVEVHYNSLSPFMWSWILYALSAILIFLSLLFKQNILKILAWGTTAVAFVLHTYGFALRVYLTERPPVSNMYETVVWVAWGAIVFTSIFSLIKKKSYILLAGTIVAALSMIVADRAPLILDATLQPLEPVLRSNLWLIVHVMTITLSYAAFFLALGIADVGLFYIIKGEKAESPMIRDFVDTCYKTLQVGVVLLAAGTILGGVWADYSWGRFWGWDPKETWALIALLGYIALLHGRLAGFIKNYGMLAGSVVAFNLVLMAWYGVNFVLGAGLHSYGFGAGGIEYVAAFIGIQFLYVIYSGLVVIRK